MAGAGAVAHDLLCDVFKMELSDREQVRAGKLVAVALGLVAIVFGVLFEKMNVTFLVGWAFNVAASANLPALVMLLFWKRTTKQGIIAAMSIGLVGSLAWILVSADTLEKIYGFSAADAASRALVPFSQPAIVTVPLGFLTLIVVSIFTSTGITKPQTSPGSA